MEDTDDLNILYEGKSDKEIIEEQETIIMNLRFKNVQLKLENENLISAIKELILADKPMTEKMKIIVKGNLN